MSDTTITNIPSTLDTRVREPSDGAQVPPPGPGSSDRFNIFTSITIEFFFWKLLKNLNVVRVTPLVRTSILN